MAVNRRQTCRLLVTGIALSIDKRCLGPLRRQVKLDGMPGPRYLRSSYDVEPRIRLMPRADSSDFGKNPAAGLSAMRSV